jgi:hypothetical protein
MHLQEKNCLDFCKTVVLQSETFTWKPVATFGGTLRTVVTNENKDRSK